MTAAVSTYRDRPPLRRRLGSLALALLVELALILAFVGLNFRPKVPDFAGDKVIQTIDLSSTNDRRSATPAEKRKDVAKPVPKPATTSAHEPPKLPIEHHDLPFIPMGKADLASVDFALQSSKAADTAQNDSPRVGTAPNGEPLYAAEWYREPTDAELAGYLPASMPDEGGSGLVACRTVSGYRVEDCVELGSDPPGSHLGGAVRQAAWQFRVRPPRVGGKSLVGTWVRIRIDYRPGRRTR